MKVCNKCKIEKELIEFHFRKDSNKYRNECKECHRKIDNNRYKIKTKENSFKMLNIKNLFNDGFIKCTKCNIIKNLNFFSNIKIKKNGKRSHCKECHRKIYNAYYKKNKSKIIKNTNLYSKNNSLKIYKYLKNRRLKNPLYKLSCNTRSLISQSIKRNGYSKKSRTYKILGCSYEDFKIHLEKQFTEGMNWENQGEWHLDHIYPISRAIDEEHLIKLNHYTNFQPLWAEDNLKKGNKI